MPVQRIPRHGLSLEKLSPDPPRRMYIWLVARPTAIVKRGQLASWIAMQVMLASGIFWLAAKGFRFRMSGGGDPTCIPSRFHTC